MKQWVKSWEMLVLAWTVALFGMSYSDVYTSSKKIEDMVLQEEHILNDLQTAVNELGNETATSFFHRFYQERMPKARQRRHDAHLLSYLKHPNGVYHSIKQFATDYENIRSTLKSPYGWLAEGMFMPVMKYRRHGTRDKRTNSQSLSSYSLLLCLWAKNLSPRIEKQLSSIADKGDLKGARLSFLRLQDIYSFNTSDMVRGNYFGIPGPKLNEADVLEIGEAAFNDNRWEHAVAWLQEALESTRPREPTVAFFETQDSREPQARVLAMLGRAYLRQGQQDKAMEMYRRARSADDGRTDEHLTALENELKLQPQISVSHPEDEDLKRLCSLQNKLTQKRFDRRLTCSYKSAILPYYRFKQELVSVSPYVALFYEVISNREIDEFTRIARNNLYRGTVEKEGSATVNSERTSDLSFVWDDQSPIVEQLSKRVAAITDLKASEHKREATYNAEPFQVVNYGMGGHYTLHHDFFYQDTLKNKAELPMFKHGGNRLATFLLYLTDVERGGSTVFSKLDLAVSPLKRAALFWYSIKPSGELDYDTLHAGCPVIVGHKWVSNKWFWLYGNTFTRRCGLTPEATQLDIEPYMRKGWV